MIPLIAVALLLAVTPLTMVVGVHLKNITDELKEIKKLLK